MDNDIILIDKPAGISSFGVVAKVRGFLRSKYGRKIKVGHTGTLDPFATGLLILLTGKMTKNSNDFLKKDKVYEAVLKLGYTSTTGDPEGKIQKFPTQARPQHLQTESQHYSTKASQSHKAISHNKNDETHPNLDNIDSTLKSFLGKITQTPPKYSAIKINGERAYKLARKGTDFNIPSRTVEIYSIGIIYYSYPELKIRIHCSSGTYIRTLAEDIGEALDTGAYLTALRRTKIADYDIKDAHPLTNFIMPLTDFTTNTTH